MYDLSADELDPMNGFDPEACASKDCNGADHSDLKPCEACGRRVCEGCRSNTTGVVLCEQCDGCEFEGCKDKAIVFCGGCSRIVCGDHLRKHPLKTECRGCNPRPDNMGRAA